MAHCKTQFVFLIHVLPGQRNFNVISLSRTIYIYRESIYINHPNSYFISINLVQNKQNLAPCLQFWKTFQIGNGSLGLKSDIPLVFFFKEKFCSYHKNEADLLQPVFFF